MRASMTPYHAALRAGQAEIAAAGGAGRRSAKIAAAPMIQAQGMGSDTAVQLTLQGIRTTVGL